MNSELVVVLLLLYSTISRVHFFLKKRKNSHKRRPNMQEITCITLRMSGANIMLKYKSYGAIQQGTIFAYRNKTMYSIQTFLSYADRIHLMV